ncbi:MAG: hypothetical protein PUC29_00340, partial [Clostridia bacterium]|nr:hypothetical protein [Clostridia bacterium]
SASVIIRENPETGEKLTQTVKRLCENPSEIRKMEEKIKAFAIPDANKKIYLDICRLVKGKK